MKNGKILVVGGAGYIGSHVVMELIKHGWDVVILDNFSTGNIRLVHPDACLVKGTLDDVNLLDQLFAEHKFSAVMHFAAFSQVAESVREPLRYYRNNISGTINLLEAMIRHSILYFIFSSTAAVYGDPECIPILETHPCRPSNPYGRTKLMIEHLLSDCDAAHGFRYMTLRYFNAAGADESGTIGEMHNPETHLIPIVLEAAAGLREHVYLYGTDYSTPDGTCIRDYIHVSDLAGAHLLALKTLLNNGKSNIYNVGNETGYSVKEVIEKAEEIVGKRIPVIETNRRPGDPATLIASSEKIRMELGWTPSYGSLDAMILTAWNWLAQSNRSNNAKSYQKRQA
ncbi:UDP-glucose 4-epimerase GalE [Desulfosarcina sp. OttesenSCG-928-A07]|nr:UDP-glucose 4-epimerase GalE [Desulfosarcina sp. OttesenSCG-928-G17]MDL2330186.1 UDP-glucose 4-epimerase GalE [Desulfosarcina sp. OttesenSCG-928-A07]